MSKGATLENQGLFLRALLAEDLAYVDEGEVVSDWKYEEPGPDREYEGDMDFVFHVLADYGSDNLGPEDALHLYPGEHEFLEDFAKRDDQLRSNNILNLKSKYPNTDYGQNEYFSDTETLAKRLKTLEQLAEEELEQKSGNSPGKYVSFETGLTPSQINQAINKLEVSERWKDTEL